MIATRVPAFAKPVTGGNNENVHVHKQNHKVGVYYIYMKNRF